MGRGKGKRVHVDMTDECHSVSKHLAAKNHKTLSDTLYFPARHEIHKEALCCKEVAFYLEKHNIAIDANATKPCYGFRCKNCIHETACLAGIYKGVCELDVEKAAKLITPYGKKELTRLQLEWGQRPQFPDSHD